MLICLFLWPRLSRRWRPLLVAYPIGMGLSLIYLGEHYLIDILLGWAYAGATILIVNWGAERWAERQRRQKPAQAVARKAEPQPG
jgi:membrane-associated phospholipid phosphatase